MPRYNVGIDLGTTNSVVHYIDTLDADAAPRLFRIPQIVAPGELEALDALPSFLYLPDEKDVPAGSLALPWAAAMDYCVGELARKNSPTAPSKVVSSAKSWLCAENVDRSAPILPWSCQRPERKLSPLEATRRLLAHLRDAWDDAMAKDDPALRLSAQTVILTVPASFDAVARELTVKAAEAADLAVALLEEPQAAFYAWLHETGDAWRAQVSSGDVILVCDIGGGTTDFSLIKVADRDGNLELERVAVGKHILLGGDNMDLAAAYAAAAKLQRDKNMKLDNHQLAGLTHACREAKEALLSGDGKPSRKLTVLGRGSGLIGGSVSVELGREELAGNIVDGFFPLCPLADRPADNLQHGLRTFGLRYEADPAVTRHLAAFVSKHCLVASRPDDLSSLPRKVLFNGGVTKSPAITARIIEALSSWLPSGAAEVVALKGNNPDLAVALGASRYAEVREGRGVRIKAGSSHAYYVGIESSMPAIPGFTPPLRGLCALPLGTEEGSGLDIPFEGLGLLVGETTEFRFFASTSRTSDVVGSVVEDAASDPDLAELPALTATLPVEGDVPAGSLVPVRLRSELTETGTLQLWCVAESGSGRWKLDFELRDEKYLARADDKEE